MPRMKVLLCSAMVVLVGCSSERPSVGSGEASTSVRFLIPEGCRKYTEEYFSKKLVDKDGVRFYVEEIRVRFEALSTVNAIGVIEGPPRIDDISLARLILGSARGCYPNTYVEFEVHDDTDAFELGVSLKHILEKSSQIASIVLVGGKVRVYYRDYATPDEILSRGEVGAEPGN